MICTFIKLQIKSFYKSWQTCSSLQCAQFKIVLESSTTKTVLDSSTISTVLDLSTILNVLGASTIQFDHICVHFKFEKP